MPLLRPIVVASALVGLALAFATGTTAAASAPAAAVAAAPAATAPTAPAAAAPMPAAVDAPCRSADTVASTGWAGLRSRIADRDLSFRGTVDYAFAAPGTSAWLSVGGGGRTLDLIQVGIHDCATGPRFFAAWGSGTPTLAGSTYEEVDLGAADLHAHTFAISLRSGTWRLSIDGHVVRSIADDFRTWKVAWIQSMAESHTGTMPTVVVTRLARTQAGAAARAAFGYTEVGAPALAARFQANATGFTVAAR